MLISSERKLRAQLSSTFVGIADSLAPDQTFPIKSPISRSHRDFGGGAVGLGIVAALIAGGGALQRSDPVMIAGGGAPQRSDPIVIAAARPAARTEMIVSITEEEEEEERAEMSESYTCVTSLVGGRPVSKRVYFHGGGGGDGNWVTRVPIKPVSPVKLALSAPVAAEFLSHCDLCGKKLFGLDVFMYKGDKAFCSVECRWQQILGDELIEQCGPGAMKGLDLSASPCSAPLLFAPGVTAA